MKHFYSGEKINNFVTMSLTIKQLNKSRTPIVKINRELDKLSDKILFPEKLERANKVLMTIGPPRAKKLPHK